MSIRRPAAPAAADPAPAHTGHNRAPLDELIPAEFRAELLRERPDFLTRFADVIAAADRAEAIDDETLGRCGDLVKICRAMDAHVTATHKAVKEPHLLAGRLCDAEKNALAEQLATAKRKVEDKANAFIARREAAARAERERIAAEERAAAERAAAAERERIRAEQLAAEAARSAAGEEERIAAEQRAAKAAREAEEAMKAAALAPAAPSRSEPVRSDAGATVSGKQEWKSEVTDYQLAFIAVEDNAHVRAAIDKAVAALVRAGKREIPGTRIWPVAKASFR
ncbi:MAG: hypothetical protein LBV50_05365 [Novosphingobium sp.]|jgi:hypothetical protein|nr:hypothetical protein [Novosphingobium sp.]